MSASLFLILCVSSAACAELVSPIIDVGFVKSGSEVSGIFYLKLSGSLDYAKIDFGCSCGTSNFSNDGSGTLLFTYTPSMEGDFNKLITVKCGSSTDKLEYCLPAIIKGRAWLPLRSNRASISTKIKTIKTESLELSANPMVNTVQILSVTTSADGFYLVEREQNDNGAHSVWPLTVKIVPNYTRLIPGHYDNLVVEYTYNENNRLHTGALRIPLFCEK